MMRPILAAVLVLFPLLAGAQNSAPEATAFVDSIPAARDIARPGTISVSVDATDVTRGIFSVTEMIPVSGSEALTLLYPKWLPGHHSDNGPIKELAGIRFFAGKKPLAWRRDPVDVYGFHIDVPQGVSSIEAHFQFLGPTDITQGRVVTTPDMLELEWNTVVLYPAGYYARRIQMEGSVKLPDDWKADSALEAARQKGATVHYRPVPLDVLIDSPVLAGANTRVETLAPGVRLDVVADLPEQLAATADQLQAHRNLVTQALKLFGAQHYDHYDFLLSLSDRMGGIGLEHHRCSEDGTGANYFTEWKDTGRERNLCPHEYVHSWCGKFRRPADLWTPDYREPMRDSLLWVYEGQTQFWGYVLSARSGMLSKQETLDAIASIAARLDNDAGRQWRSVEDTTDDPIISQRRPKAWRSWQRSEDYYNEGLLVWLDADSLIRQESHGQHSMDDFARAFFGVRNGDWGELTYTFNDIVDTLNTVQPHDWASFLRARLDQVSDHAPLDGITRGGYKLIYTDTPTAWTKAAEKSRKTLDLSDSGGFVLGKEGAITEVAWDSPAFNAGLTVGAKIIAVNGRALENEQLRAAIKARKSPLHLLLRIGDNFRDVDLVYDGGLRYPRLEQLGSGPSSLDALLAPKP